MLYYCKIIRTVRTQCSVYYKPCIAYQRHNIVQKVVKSFTQDV